MNKHDTDDEKHEVEDKEEAEDDGDNCGGAADNDEDAKDHAQGGKDEDDGFDDVVDAEDEDEDGFDAVVADEDDDDADATPEEGDVDAHKDDDGTNEDRHHAYNARRGWYSTCAPRNAKRPKVHLSVMKVALARVPFSKEHATRGRSRVHIRRSTFCPCKNWAE